MLEALVLIEQEAAAAGPGKAVFASAAPRIVHLPVPPGR